MIKCTASCFLFVLNVQVIYTFNLGNVQVIIFPSFPVFSFAIRSMQLKNYSIKSSIDLSEIAVEYIRNFSIIAHVDHGKSTLADRILEFTGAIKQNSGVTQVLDKLQVEKERGITVKAQSTSLLYNYKNETYLLNLIDTPGHVDFSNEVGMLVNINLVLSKVSFFR